TQSTGWVLVVILKIIVNYLDGTKVTVHLNMNKRILLLQPMVQNI
ncbi:11525_t:CDS:1, partial [Rhizophagus irregularis]